MDFHFEGEEQWFQGGETKRLERWSERWKKERSWRPEATECSHKHNQPASIRGERSLLICDVRDASLFQSKLFFLTLLFFSWLASTGPVVAGTPMPLRSWRTPSSWPSAAAPASPTGETQRSYSTSSNSDPLSGSRLVEQVLSRLQPGLSEARLASALENLGRWLQPASWLVHRVISRVNPSDPNMGWSVQVNAESREWLLEPGGP